MRTLQPGKARGFLRCRREIGRFYKHHHIQSGACVELCRLAERSYRLALPRPRAAEFFAGVGLVRLALEREGWEVVFATTPLPCISRLPGGIDSP